jgi:geranylgeranyl pyrophosphate synthase
MCRRTESTRLGSTDEIAGQRAERETAAVESLLQHGGARLETLMASTEAHLQQATADVGASLGGYVTAGGKRVRPMLVLLAAEASPTAVDGGRAEHLVRAAVAVELMHSATLAHDDVLDGARLRRGHPTVVAVAGRKAAVATGDVLFARAFAELSRNRDVAQLQALSDASVALAVGELLQREDLFSQDVSVDRYLERCELKTAALFEVACRLGALVVAGGLPQPPDGNGAGMAATPGALSAAVANGRAARLEGAAASHHAVLGGHALGNVLGGFARRVGLAFQLIDDVLDVAGPVDETGKWRGTDLLDGTVTLPLILARQCDPELASLDLRQLRGPKQAAVVCEQIAATGVLDEARDWAFEIVRQAKQELPSALPPRLAELLNLVADAVVERYR